MRNRSTSTHRRQRVKLSVLLIPSKENTILDSLPQSTPHLESIRQLVESERALIESYRIFFEQIGGRDRVGARRAVAEDRQYQGVSRQRG